VHDHGKRTQRMPHPSRRRQGDGTWLWIIDKYVHG
jgi:hypothetical protein